MPRTIARPRWPSRHDVPATQPGRCGAGVAPDHGGSSPGRPPRGSSLGDGPTWPPPVEGGTVGRAPAAGPARSDGATRWAAPLQSSVWVAAPLAMSLDTAGGARWRRRRRRSSTLTPGSGRGVAGDGRDSEGPEDRAAGRRPCRPQSHRAVAVAGIQHRRAGRTGRASDRGHEPVAGRASGARQRRDRGPGSSGGSWARPFSSSMLEMPWRAHQDATWSRTRAEARGSAKVAVPTWTASAPAASSSAASTPLETPPDADDGNRPGRPGTRRRRARRRDGWPVQRALRRRHRGGAGPSPGRGPDP